MSLHAKLHAAASAAAAEAAAIERGRCLWCVDQVIKDLKIKLRGKLLTEIELHAANMKIKIADAFCGELRRAIVSGIRPAGQQVPGPVGLSPNVEGGDA